MKMIQARELNDKKEGAVLLDVRTAGEFGEIHIPGSRLLPLHELNEAQASAVRAEGKACYVICRTGNRAKQAAQKLKDAGHEEVGVLEGGVQAWEEAGLEVNRGKKAMSIERQVRIGAGSLVVLGVVLGVTVSPWFLVLSGFVGCGLIFAGLTDWCGMGLMLARMPWNTRRPSAEGGAACAR